MAGAMRLGELAHLMESRLLDGEVPARATPQLFDALDDDLDHIAYILDALRRGEFDVRLPWVAAPAEEPAAAAPPEPPERRRRSSSRRRPRRRFPSSAPRHRKATVRSSFR